MNIKNRILLLPILSLLIIAFMLVFTGCRKKTDVLGNHSAWMTDFEKAKQTARSQGKDLLINFAGSDWCYWCQRLDGEVFSRTDFLEKAGKDFVFVLVDFPNDTSGQSVQLQRQNEKLAEQFGIEYFPTVFLADADGKPYARTGYLEGGVKSYLENLKRLKGQRVSP